MISSRRRSQRRSVEGLSNSRPPHQPILFGRKRLSSRDHQTSSGPDEKKCVAPTEHYEDPTDLGQLVDLEWYPLWLRAQRANLPSIITVLSMQGGAVSEDSTYSNFYQCIAAYARENRGFSIDDVVEHLHNKKYFANELSHELGAKRMLVFATLGWQAMVYRPEFNICSLEELAVNRDASEPDSGLVFDSYKVPAEMCDRPLYVLLKCFGNLLPARSSNRAVAAVESSKAAASWTALYPTELNAYLLYRLLNVRFRWVDTLALHLDYDKSTRTLSLFGFPSVCVTQLHERRGTIFAFASTEIEAADPRADEDDIAGFLEEVLLSYRLLFGQSSKSRKLFREVFDGTEPPCPRPDTLLPWLCTDKQAGSWTTAAWVPKDRRVYYAARDFPVLYERIELLGKELNSAKPQSMGHLLRDRRDTLQFWTFWLVTVVGGVSVLLGVIQVVLQAVQIAQAAGRI